LTGMVLAVIGAAGMWATWQVFVVHETGQRLDQAAFEGAHYGRTRLWQLAEPVLEVVSIPFLVVVLVGAAVVAVLRKRWALGFQAALIIAGSNVSTQVLKKL